MKTFNRICIKTEQFIDVSEDPPRQFTLERGKEYLTSEEKDGEVTVFTRYWFKAPIGLFAGEVKFT